MSRVEATLIDDYVRELDGRLRGPARLKGDMLTEVRDGLTDAAEGYRADGLPVNTAQRHAVAEFGPVARLVVDFQTEISARSVRTLAGRTLVVAIAARLGGDLTWRGSSWSGPSPPASYLFLSAAIGWVWLATALAAGTGLAVLTWLARRGPGAARPVRLAGLLLAVALAGTLVNSIALWGWSVWLWPAALSWPPMQIGLVVLVTAYGWLGAGARYCLPGAR